MASVHYISAFPSAQPAHVTRKRSNTSSTASTSASGYDEKGYPLKPECHAQPRLRSRTVSGYSYEAASASNITSYPYTPASESSSIRSTSQSPRTDPARNAPSPAPSSSGSSRSGKSVRWSDKNEYATIDVDHRRHDPTDMKASPDHKLLGRKVKGALRVVAHTFADSVSRDTTAKGTRSNIRAAESASLAVDEVLRDIVIAVKEFKCPSELDFSVHAGSHLILANVKKNKPFIKQLRKLDALRTRLAGISTQGDEDVEKKHAAAGLAVKAALERMSQYQLKLYERFVGGALDDLTLNLSACVKQFEYPSELDFATNAEGVWALANTERNQPFMAQLRTLDWFQQELNRIPIYDNEGLKDRSRAVGLAIERANLRLKKHQLKASRRAEFALGLGLA